MEQELSLLVSIVAGTLLTFGGWTLYRAGIRLIGFLIGCVIGVALSYTILSLFAHQHPSLGPYIPWIVVGVALLLGLLNAKIFMKMYYLVVFVAGAVYGAMLKVNWIDSWPVAAGWMDSLGPVGESPWGELIAAVLLGLLCVVLHRYLIIVLTSLLGSALIALSSGIHWTFPLFVLLGLLFQLGFLRVFKLRPPARTKRSE